ncbi:hypothetical protein GGF31_004599 [Allomyces arbusculus]|nr:hypothetical protein GGF31_004599 [Allomyces arbusculus]
MVRYKYRYLVFSVSYGDDNAAVDPDVTASIMDRRIRATAEIHFGPHGLGLMQSNLGVKYFSGFTGIGIVRVARDHYRMLWATLTFLNAINNRRCRIVVLHCSGTIRKAQQAALEHDRVMLKVALHHMEAKGKGGPAAEKVLAKIGDENAALIQTCEMG